MLHACLFCWMSLRRENTDSFMNNDSFHLIKLMIKNFYCCQLGTEILKVNRQLLHARSKSHNFLILQKRRKNSKQHKPKETKQNKTKLKLFFCPTVVVHTLQR